MQSFLTIVLAAFAAFFAFAMMPPDPQSETAIYAEEAPEMTLAEVDTTPVIIVEPIEPLVLALDYPINYEGMVEFDADAFESLVD